MKRLNITIDNEIYEKARAIAFIKRISISEIIRNSLKDWMKKNTNKEIEVLLSESNEARLLSILENDEFISSDKVKQKLGIC